MIGFTNTAGCSLRARHAVAATLLAFAALAGTSSGETIVNFGDLSLAPNTYWNGADSSGGFASSGAQFNNQFFSGWGTTWWGGWSYSAVNDTTTPGFANQYAAITGAGLGGSGIYAVGYVNAYDAVLPTITVPTGMQVQSAMLTNTTWAYLAMLDGCSPAAKFTDTDWFDLTISGLDANNQPVGTPVNFYLAQDGNIVDAWTPVNLSSLAAARTLEFNLTSTDNGPYGMNTPAYFALGSLNVVGRAGAFDVRAVGAAGVVAMFWGRRRGKSLQTAALGAANRR